MDVTLGTSRIYVERTTPTGAELAAMYDEAAERWQSRLKMLGYPRAYDDLFARLEADGTLGGLRDGGRVLGGNKTGRKRPRRAAQLERERRYTRC